MFRTPDEVIGRVLSVTVPQGAMLTQNMLASTATGGQFSILEPGETVAPDSESWRAVSITVPDDRAVGGMLQPGMTVDVLMSATVNVPQDLTLEGKYYTDKSTKITYQNMVILAKTGQSYIVKATLTVAEEITHLLASGNATFSMVMRPEADVRNIDVSQLGATTNRLIAKYGLPVPEVYPPGNGPLPTPLPLPTASPTPSASPSPRRRRSSPRRPAAGRVPATSPSAGHRVPVPRPPAHGASPVAPLTRRASQATRPAAAGRVAARLGARPRSGGLRRPTQRLDAALAPSSAGRSCR